MMPNLAHVALIVHDYDEAIAWFTEKLGFTLVGATNPSPLAGEGDSAQLSGVRDGLGEAEAEQGMAKMSDEFRAQGGEIYLPARRPVIDAISVMPYL